MSMVSEKHSKEGKKTLRRWHEIFGRSQRNGGKQLAKWCKKGKDEDKRWFRAVCCLSFWLESKREGYTLRSPSTNNHHEQQLFMSLFFCQWKRRKRGFFHFLSLLSLTYGRNLPRESLLNSRQSCNLFDGIKAFPSFLSWQPIHYLINLFIHVCDTLTWLECCVTGTRIQSSQV